ncbi:hypothetical protein BLAT2472_10439 [Burkholderia latens]
MRQRGDRPDVERVTRRRAPGAHPFPLLLDDGVPHGEPWGGRSVNLHYGHSGCGAGYRKRRWQMQVNDATR